MTLPCSWPECPEPAELRVVVQLLEGPPEGGVEEVAFDACRPHAHEYAAPWRRVAESGAAQRARTGRGGA